MLTVLDEGGVYGISWAELGWGISRADSVKKLFQWLAFDEVWLVLLTENDEGPFGRRENISAEKPPVLWKSTRPAGNAQFTLSNCMSVRVGCRKSCAVAKPEFNAGVGGSFFLLQNTKLSVSFRVPSEEAIALTSKKKKKEMCMLIGPFPKDH